MKKNLTLILFSLVFSLSCISQLIEKSVKIGNQIWTAENLNVTKFRSGAIIPEAKPKEQWEKAGNEGTPMWCYYNFDAGNEKKYGKLYNWHAVKDARGLAPAGWHVSTDADWTTLLSSFEKHNHTRQLKSAEGWSRDGNGTNESGFAALPGGNIMYFGNFTGVGDYAYFWTSTPTSSGNTGWSQRIDYSNGVDVDMARTYDSHQGCGLSVRCVKD